MKKAFLFTFIISGILCSLMLGIFIFSNINISYSYNKALASGNNLYAIDDYNGALEAYNKGLLKRPDDDKLNYNSGLCAYSLDDHNKALEHYNKTSDQLEKYLKSGNSYLRLGELEIEPKKKMQLFEQAMEFYKNGVIKFPDNVDIKFNYEYIKRLLEELEDNSNESQDDAQNEDQQNEDQENEDQENKDQQSEENEGQGDEQENTDNNSNDSEESQDNTEENQQRKQEENEENSQERKDSKEDSESSNQDDKGQQDDVSDLSDTDINDELAQALRVLEMLEKLEEESLKNNQGVIIDGKESEYDW